MGGGAPPQNVLKLHGRTGRLAGEYNWNHGGELSYVGYSKKLNLHELEFKEPHWPEEFHQPKWKQSGRWRLRFEEGKEGEDDRIKGVWLFSRDVKDGDWDRAAPIRCKRSSGDVTPAPLPIARAAGIWKCQANKRKIGTLNLKVTSAGNVFGRYNFSTGRGELSRTQQAGVGNKVKLNWRDSWGQKGWWYIQIVKRGPRDVIEASWGYVTDDEGKPRGSFECQR